jgi:hypothetical protein
MITVGDKVIYRGENWGHLVSVIGTVVEDLGNKVVIVDDHAETDDDRLEFYKSSIKLLREDNHV